MEVILHLATYAGFRRLAFASIFATLFAAAGPLQARDLLVLAGTNGAPVNTVAVFRLDTSVSPASLSLLNTVATGGAGGASGNAGAVQFGKEFGVAVNYGSNNISQLSRVGNTIHASKLIPLPEGCTAPLSAALSGTQMLVAGTNCAATYTWPAGTASGAPAAVSDSSVAQIVAGETWAGITLKSGSILRLPLNQDGSLTGQSTPVPLAAGANDTPLGAAFWGDLLGFNPAHSANSFALVNASGTEFAVPGPQPPYPANAPCWLAKGKGNIWYSGNSPGQSISIFFSDAEGGAFYKSVPVPGTPTDLSVSADGAWLAVIYTADDGAHAAVYAIDSYGGLSLTATSAPIGVSSFNGVAISE